ncbi:inactive protein kinase SELMODRAFT_444075 isoform X3 [Daucus carota subsp. sativus]|uniref:inactive protein kinase SELMODRAFT_444075 isoform X3 n=1 Tax=Daucus carota subsp. sativus TaxID=79200 RepID=UPI0030834910
MDEATAVQKVVVIQDASREVSWSAIRYVMTNTQLLKAGDELILIPVLHQVNNPMGYKNKVDSSSMFGSNSKMVAEEVCRIDELYRKTADMKQISMQCEQQKNFQIKLVLKVYAGQSARVVAIEAALNLEATWVVLDRQMKKDKKYFMEKLSCGISRMKRDNTIEKLRGPKTLESTLLVGEKSTSGYVSYGEMIPDSCNNDLSPQNSPSAQEQASGNKLSFGDICKAPRLDSHHKSYVSSSKSSFSTDHTMWSSTIPSSASTSNTEGSSSSFVEVNNFLSTFHKDQKYHKLNAKDPEKEQEFQNAICSVCKNRRPKSGWKRDFSYAELHEATDGFSDKNFLSEGGFGCVYKGRLKNGLQVAVKQHKDASLQGEKEFKSEVYVLSKARHQNLVMLLGSCSEGSHRLLVYEYVCDGSLDQHLSKHTKKPLNWGKRIKIALGAAEGLEFLQKNKIIHRDVRPNNILVTHDHESLLGDFGLARNQYDDLENPSENSVVGTLGYVAPEYAECGKASTKTDVYSFGVVLLQLITGLRTTDKSLGAKSLVGWARPLLKEKNYPDLIDSRIGDSFDVHQLFWMVRLAEKCLSLDPSKRYNMTRVVNALHYIMESNTSFIKDFSPTQSDSLNSTTESTQSQAGSRTYESKEDTEQGKKLKIDDVFASSKTAVSVSEDHYDYGESEAAALEKNGLLYNEMII